MTEERHVGLASCAGHLDGWVRTPDGRVRPFSAGFRRPEESRPYVVRGQTNKQTNKHFDAHLDAIIGII